MSELINTFIADNLKSILINTFYHYKGNLEALTIAGMIEDSDEPDNQVLAQA